MPLSARGFFERKYTYAGKDVIGQKKSEIQHKTRGLQICIMIKEGLPIILSLKHPSHTQ